MAHAHTVSLKLASTGVELLAWDRYSISLDMFSPGSPWSCTIWHSETRESAWRQMLHQTRLGDGAIFAIDDAVQMNGRIETRDVAVSREGAAIVLSGRDMAGPAIDWDADPRLSLKGKTLRETLEALFRPLGITVIVGASADAGREVQTRVRTGAHGTAGHRVTRSHRVDLSHPRHNERVWQCAESIVKKLGYMLWIAPDGDGGMAVVVDVPNYDQENVFSFERRVRNGTVTANSNILESKFSSQIRNIPTHVYAFGRSRRGDSHAARHRSGLQNRRFFEAPDPDFLNFDSSAPPSPGQAPAAVTPSGSATVSTLLPNQNDDLARYPLVIDPLPPQPRYLNSRRANNPATGRQEAARVMAEAMRSFRTYTCTVQGHGQDVGGSMRLFAFNTMAHVYDRLSEIDEDMLIHSVAFDGGRQGGQTTKVTLGTKGACVLVPESD